MSFLMNKIPSHEQVGSQGAVTEEGHPGYRK